MKSTKLHLLLPLLLLLTACQTQSAPAPTPLPPTHAPTATLESIPPTEIPTDLFGFINSNEAQTGLMLEPVVSQIFEGELDKLVEAGEIESYQVESLGVYPKDDGTLYAEVFYAIQSGEPFWPEDGGIPGEGGWITGKCSRFDFVINPEEYQLENKRLCS
jgi:hypothetical protein